MCKGLQIFHMKMMLVPENSDSSFKNISILSGGWWQTCRALQQTLGLDLVNL
jgi:hypothetical protein